MLDAPPSDRRAAEMLGLSPDATPAEARAAFLRRLARVDFVPPVVWCAGLSQLDRTANRGGFRCVPNALETTNALRADLERFRRDYWHLDLAERKQRWQQLHDRCRQEARLLRQVRALVGGLTMTQRQFDAVEGMQAEIAELIRDTFPLNPLERTNRRNAWMATLKPAAAWRLTARLFRKDHPELAALDSGLIEALSRLEAADAVQPTMRFVERESTPQTQWPLGVVIIVMILIISVATLLWTRHEKTQPQLNIPAPVNPLDESRLSSAQKAIADALRPQHTFSLKKDYGSRVIADALSAQAEIRPPGARP